MKFHSILYQTSPGRQYKYNAILYSAFFWQWKTQGKNFATPQPSWDGCIISFDPKVVPEPCANIFLRTKIIWGTKYFFGNSHVTLLTNWHSSLRFLSTLLLIKIKTQSGLYELGYRGLWAAGAADHTIWRGQHWAALDWGDKLPGGKILQIELSDF